MVRVHGFIKIGSLLLLAGSVQAQFYNTIQHLIGERAAGMSGAYTSLANNSSALWYNPAGLSLLENSSLNVSMSSYSFMTTNVTGFRQFEKYDGSSKQSLDLKESDLSIVGTSLVYGRKVDDKTSWAFGIFAPIQENVVASFGGVINGNFQTGIINTTQGPAEFGPIQIESSTSAVSKNYVGLFGFGYKIFEWAQFGLSIGLGQYTNNVSKSDYSLYTITLNGTDNQLFNDFKVESKDQTSYIGYIGVGFAAQLGSGHYFGANFRTPSHRISGTEEIIRNTDEEISRKTRDLDFFTKQFSSTAQFGYAFTIPDDFSIAFDVAPSIEAFILGTGVPFDERPLSYFNFLVGVEKKVMNKFWVRAGSFTDLNNLDDIKNDLNVSKQIDYYGSTFSVSFPKVFKVQDVEGEHTKTLKTTVGLYYRYGTGERRIKYFQRNLSEVSRSPVSQNIHNVSIFVGESLSF